jgi:hypothetical protein
VDVDTTGWSGDGEFTQRLIDAIQSVPGVRFLKVEDAPASRADAGFSFISNELFVAFEVTVTARTTWRLGVIPVRTAHEARQMSLAGLEAALAGVESIGAPDYSDEGMLQYLRSERVIPAYQTKGYKLVELVRIYEAGTAARDVI